jgi:hypothetical protein
VTERDVYKQFKGQWILRGNEHYITNVSSEAFADFVMDHGWRILGIEGFILTEKSTEPLMDLIADYSSGIPSRDDVLQFLRGGEKATHFSFVLGDQ